MKGMKYSVFSFAIVILFVACNPTSRTSLRDNIPHVSSEDKALLDRVQQETFNYFWEAGEPISGAARERFHADGNYPHQKKDIVTIGGTVFCIMATIVAAERGFVSKKQVIRRFEKLIGWLEAADRYHGVWSHWYNPSGKTYPFSRFDDGGDIVETAFLAQALITARQYFQNGNKREKQLALKMDQLWKDIEWDWYTKGENVLYWHWSQNHGFKMNFDIRGHNECLIVYVLAASSEQNGVEPAVFHKGYMMDGKVYTNREYLGIPLVLDHFETNNMAVGPLFWAHYSHLGLNPLNLKNERADFWKANQNMVKIHYLHCLQNPNDYAGYGEDCWGFTSSYSIVGYAGHNPQEDLGVISPTAALSSFPYTPEESLRFLQFLYKQTQSQYVGEYGPYDAFSKQSNWFEPWYLAIDQLPIPVMIENYRSGLLWDLFMSAPEVQNGLKDLGFDFEESKLKK